jgi:hypothetical protein
MEQLNLMRSKIKLWQMRNSFLLLLVFLSTVEIHSQLSSFDYNGYAKYMFSSTKFPDATERYSDHLLHARLNTRWYPTSSLTGAVEFRFRAFYGETVENFPRFVDFIKTPRDWVDLDAVLWETNSSVGYLELDRLWLDWVNEDLDVTIGRQRIAWGTAWVWNPTDLFNPLDILDFDYEERPATDGLRLQYYTGAVTKVEFSYKPAKDPYNQILAGLWSINKWDYDFNLIGGMRFKRWLAGFSWAGDILDAGFRGEVLVSQAPSQPDTNRIYQLIGEPSLSSFDKPLISMVLSADYTFPNTFYIHTEILYNNNGKSANTFLFLPEAYSLGMLTAARWSVYQEFSYDITPLLRGSLFGIFNPNDGSYAIVPSFTYSLITNLDLLFIGQFFEGDPLTEFGEYGSSFYLRFKYSF